MEHDRIHVFQNGRIEDTRLTQRNPVTQTGFRENRFRAHFADCIMVIDADFDRVAGTCPVNRRVAVAGLGHSADINDLDRIGIRLCLNGAHNVFGGGDIGADRLARIVVRGGRNHAANMQDVVRAGHETQHCLIIRQITPDDLYGRIVRIRHKLFAVLFAVAQQQNNVVAVLAGVQFQKSLKAHGAGSTGQCDGRFFHSVFSFIVCAMRSTAFSTNERNSGAVLSAVR